MSSGRRELTLVCVALGAAAGAVWVSSALVWYRVTAQVPARGAVPVAFTGGQVRPALLGLATVTVAAVAAVLALSGPARRVLGGLLSVLGGWLTVIAVRTVFGPAPDSHDPGYPTPPPGVPLEAVRDQPSDVTPAPWLIIAAGMVMVLAGLWLLVREPGLPRLGARFAAKPASARVLDQDRTWWEALDAGQDPTWSRGHPSGPGADPGPGG